jgi:hypothetical protein
MRTIFKATHFNDKGVVFSEVQGTLDHVIRFILNTRLNNEEKITVVVTRQTKPLTAPKQ